MRPGILAGLVTLCIALGVAGASALLPQGIDTLGGPDDLQPDGRPAQIHGSDADPAGGLRWAVRVYHSRTGATCAEPGRASNGQFGRADSRGRLVELPVEAAGACADLSVAPLSVAVNHYPERPGQAARSVAFGVASPDVESLSLVEPDGTASGVPLDQGAFVIVRAGQGLSGAYLEVTLRDGSMIKRDLH